MDDYRKTRHKKREANRAKLHAKKAAQEARKPKPKTGVGRGVPAFLSVVEVSEERGIVFVAKTDAPLRKRQSKPIF